MLRKGINGISDLHSIFWQPKPARLKTKSIALSQTKAYGHILLYKRQRALL